MGNCQAAEAASLMIQHPEGKIERLYWPRTAEEVMKSNPGRRVALVMSDDSRLRCVRVRFLKPNHILLTGQVYRLVTEEEVTRTLKAKKDNRVKKRHLIELTEERKQEVNQGRHQQKTASKFIARTRHWEPSLRIIEEDGL